MELSTSMSYIENHHKIKYHVYLVFQKDKYLGYNQYLFILDKNKSRIEIIILYRFPISTL